MQILTWCRDHHARRSAMQANRVHIDVPDILARGLVDDPLSVLD